MCLDRDQSSWDYLFFCVCVCILKLNIKIKRSSWFFLTKDLNTPWPLSDLLGDALGSLKSSKKKRLKTLKVISIRCWESLWLGGVELFDNSLNTMLNWNHFGRWISFSMWPIARVRINVDKWKVLFVSGNIYNTGIFYHKANKQFLAGRLLRLPSCWVEHTLLLQM